MQPNGFWDPVAGILIYIQEVFWVGSGGGHTSPSTLYFSDFRTSFSFSLWLGEWDHFTRRTETFQKISNMYGYFLYTLYCMGFQWILGWGEGKWWDRQYRGGSPVCCTPGCYCYICKRQLCGFPQCAASWMTYARDSFGIPRGAFCPLEGGAQTHWHQSYNTNN